MGFAVSLGVMGVVIWGIRKLTTRIIRPLEDINSNLREMSFGNGDLTQRLQVYGNDELGQVAASFNQFVEKIHSDITLSQKSPISEVRQKTTCSLKTYLVFR